GKIAFGLTKESLAEQHRLETQRQGRLVRLAMTITCLGCGTYSLGLGLAVWPLVGIPALSAFLFFAAGVGLFSLWWK
ncbi:MAG: hypothetical protein IAG13_25650, partial [Deltaproteobacteria bacterium]|nr:hypothetical protein [Nannocystaceae bacterium]